MKELRLKKGMSQGDLSKASGVDVHRISKIERGVISMENISLINAVKIAKALGVHAEDLL